MTGSTRGPIFRTFQDAYVHVLADLHGEARPAAAPRGMPVRERIGATFQVSDPVQRHVWVPARRSNLVFNLAEVLWYLSGSAKLAPIAYYAPGIRRYSADGLTLTGSAYGPRLFTPDGGPGPGPTQWDRMSEILSADPDSRRAVLQILRAGEVEASNIDVACTLGLQFVVRRDSLACIAFMRSNDAFRGMVSDVFSFTFLQELLARQLGLGVGAYIHCAGSLHLYESDTGKVPPVLIQARDIARGRGPVDADRIPVFPPMPEGDNWPYIKKVLYYERALRENRLALTPAQLKGIDLPHYWQQIVGILECYREIVRDRLVHSNILDCLDQPYAESLRNRWPHATG